MQNTQHKTGPLRKVSIVESIISVKHHPAILTMVANQDYPVAYFPLIANPIFMIEMSEVRNDNITDSQIRIRDASSSKSALMRHYLARAELSRE
jgi:hypothetical protein